jgi:hypothetical protein
VVVAVVPLLVSGEVLVVVVVRQMLVVVLVVVLELLCKVETAVMVDLLMPQVVVAVQAVLVVVRLQPCSMALVALVWQTP